METFSALLALGKGIHRSPVDSPHKDQWRRTGVFFDLRLNKRLNKNRNTGDLRHHRAHYDVTAMLGHQPVTQLRLIQTKEFYQGIARNSS